MFVTVNTVQIATVCYDQRKFKGGLFFNHYFLHEPKNSGKYITKGYQVKKIQPFIGVFILNITFNAVLLAIFIFIFMRHGCEEDFRQ